MMSHAHDLTMTPEEFLLWEEKQERPWEFDGLRPVAMNGGTLAHSRIAGNLITALNTRLRGRPCQPYFSVKVPTIRGAYRYPDAFVSCQPSRPEDTLAPEPVVIFEVLSPGTQVTDRNTKLTEYRGIPGLLRYVMLEQTQASATVITLTGEIWSIDVLKAGDVLALPEIAIELPIDELYLGMVFEAPPQ